MGSTKTLMILIFQIYLSKIHFIVKKLISMEQMIKSPTSLRVEFNKYKH